MDKLKVTWDQFFLNNIAATDLHGFLENITNWSNHRPLLLLAFELTNGDVYEYGSGEGSTPYLRSYCNASGRNFHAYDSNKEWAEKTGATHIEDWEKESQWFSCGLAFVDLAPGEYRWRAIEHLATEADIIVIHDTEEGGAGDYKFEKIWHLFKFRLNYNKTGGGAGATAVSNKIDLNQFRGLSLGKYQFDND